MREPADSADQVELTGVVMRLLDDWGVDWTNLFMACTLLLLHPVWNRVFLNTPLPLYLVLLGLPAHTRRRGLRRYTQGVALPEDRDSLERLSYLLAIERSVRTAFPHSPSMAHLWITTPSHHFAGRTPLEVMLSDGVGGMETVARFLTCTEDWS